ncbi:3'-5' exonuclease [Duganella qianjiadongensis]|uniref:3'-5' exonuclease n=1 Tax=Duganella qianjiadongensis TaxID=2692176 RepID=A0ABW9VJ75_9BURK|nr:3'-5' exonuclease [Duganella qianjiadongensis]MYM39536.1 3'-5' exonuclease [Duganella qianjiadongensis]
MLGQSLVMLDFETTGLSPANGDRITEVAALRLREGRIVERFVSLVNCGVRIPAFITGLTGITQAMVDTAPPVAQVMPQLLDFIGGDTLAAHNASFDDKFLRAEAAALGLTPAYPALLCSLKLARRVYPGMASYRLGDLSRQLGIRFASAAHRAEADAEVASAVLLRMGQDVAQRYGWEQVAPELLVAVNQLAAAKVAQFLSGQNGQKLR